MEKEMKKAILAALVAAVATTAVAGQTTREEMLDNVQQTIDATSEGVHWLPMWNQIATNQLALMKENPEIGYSTALNAATRNVVKSGYLHNFQWDDFWYCFVPAAKDIVNAKDDVRFDYCAMVTNNTVGFVEEVDPNQNTTMGGMFWTDTGKR